MNGMRNSQKGFSLLEYMFGMIIMLVILTAVVQAGKVMMQAQVNQSFNSRVNSKLLSVQDDIRRISMTDFTGMNTNYDLTCSYDHLMSPTIIPCSDIEKSIHVEVDVHPIDVTNNNRVIVATATWTEGHTNHSKTSTWIISPFRSPTNGGSLFFRVRTVGTDLPVPMVEISAPGESLVSVGCKTNATGECVITGAKLSDLHAPPVPVHVDTRLSRHFFLKTGVPNPNTPNGGTWTMDFNQNPVLATTTVVVPTIYVYAPGVLSGSVWHKEDAGNPTNKIPNLKIAVIGRTGTMTIANNSLYDAVTDASGNFIVDKLIPGSYSIQIIGNNPEWTAVGQNGETSNESLRGALFTVTSGQTMDTNSVIFANRPQTTRRASLTLKSRLVRIGYDMSQVFHAPTAAHPINLRMSSNSNFVGIVNSVGFESLSSINNTIPYTSYWSDVSPAADRFVLGGGSYNDVEWYYFSFDSTSPIQKDYIFPRVLDRRSPIAYPLYKQRGRGYFLPEKWAPDYGASTYVPIAWNPAQGFDKAIQTYIDPVYGESFFQYTPSAQPITTPTVNTTDNVWIHMLSKDSLANLHGHIRKIDGTAFIPNAGASHSVYLRKEETGGILDYQASSTSYCFRSGMRIDTTVGTGHDYTFNTAGYNRISPTLGPIPLNVYFESTEAPAFINKDFNLKFRAFYKTYNSMTSSIDYSTTTDLATIFGGPVSMDISVYNKASAVASLHTLSIGNNAAFYPNQSWATQHSVTASGSANIGAALRPTEDRAVDITVDNFADRYADFTLQVVGIRGSFIPAWPNTAINMGPNYSYDTSAGLYKNTEPSTNFLEVYKVGRAEIKGRILDDATNPLSGVEIRVTRSKISGTFTVASHTPVTDATGSFDLSGVDFAMSPGNNLSVLIVKAGYLSVPAIVSEGYDGLVWNLGDISMTPVPAAPPADSDAQF